MTVDANSSISVNTDTTKQQALKSKAISLDAMGGDNMPHAAVEGAIRAQSEGINVVLVGDTEILSAELAKHGATVPIHDARDVITMQDHASEVRRRKESSIMQAMQLAKSGECSACVSMGHSGATMAASLFVLGRIKGVERPAIMANMPTLKGVSVLADAGANADCRPSYLQQFAVMGSIYHRVLHGSTNPQVGLMSIGEEEEKGNELTLESHQLLKETASIKFYGNIEGRDVLSGDVEVIVTDGFTGNVILKLAEGEAKTIFKWLREGVESGGPLAKLGALLLKPVFRKLRAKLDPSEYGAQPLLGVNGYAFIGHGSADSKAVYNALKTARLTVEAGLLEQLKTEIAQLS